jgi:citrate synthase
MSDGGAWASGLDDVVVAHTALSDVDGEKGQLVIRGYPVEDLVERGSFEALCGLLWDGTWPSADQRDRIRAVLADARAEAFELLPSLGDALGAADGMEALRAAVGHLRSSGDARDRLRVTAAIAVFATAWARIQTRSAPVAPRQDLGHAADCLRMLWNRDPAPAAIRGLEAYWCCVVDHGLNASTFAARLVASTRSDLISAVLAALGALKGPLHGGAPGPVLEMLDAIGSVPRARPWLESQLAAGERIMGMGHRIYRVRDPRAFALERAVAWLAERDGSAERLTLARAVEREAEQLLAERHPERLLRANVEFYTAVLLEAVGIPRTLFSPLFAASRVVGWCAHVEEQRAVGRLIRPASVYVGPRPLQLAGSPAR